MQFTIKPLVISVLLGLSLSTTSLFADEQASDANAAAAKTDNRNIVAIVNGTDISHAMLESVVDMVKRSTSGDKVDEKSVLEDLIATELARQEAKKSGLEEREDIKNKVKDFTDKLILNAWMQEKATSFKFDDKELKEAYDKRMEGTPKNEYKARHILLKTKEEAEAVIKELNESKGDFAEMAKKKSTGPSAPMGGDLGWFKPDSMVPPFAEAVSKMSVGEVSSAPVQTQFGWHIIKLEEKRDIKLPDFEKMKPQLQRLLEQEKMLNYMRSLRETADVKILLKDEPTAETEAGEEAEDEPDTSVAPAPVAEEAAKQ